MSVIEDGGDVLVGPSSLSDGRADECPEGLVALWGPPEVSADASDGLLLQVGVFPVGVDQLKPTPRSAGVKVGGAPIARLWWA